MKRGWSLWLLAALALTGCAGEKPPAELVGRWQRTDVSPLGAPSVQRLNLKADGKYALARTSAGPTISDGTRTSDNLEIIHSGKWRVDRQTMELVLTPTYFPIAGVNTAAVTPQALRSTFSVSGNRLVINNAQALLLTPPGGSAQAGYGVGAQSRGPVELQKSS
jgi:hypothetical protein